MPRLIVPPLCPVISQHTSPLFRTTRNPISILLDRIRTRSPWRVHIILRPTHTTPRQLNLISRTLRPHISRPTALTDRLTSKDILRQPPLLDILPHLTIRLRFLLARQTTRMVAETHLSPHNKIRSSHLTQAAPTHPRISVNHLLRQSTQRRLPQDSILSPFSLRPTFKAPLMQRTQLCPLINEMNLLRLRPTPRTATHPTIDRCLPRAFRLMGAHRHLHHRTRIPLTERILSRDIQPYGLCLVPQLMKTTRQQLHPALWTTLEGVLIYLLIR